MIDSIIAWILGALLGHIDPTSQQVAMGCIAGLLAISEALALIPSLKANGILHFIITILKKEVPAK